MTTEQQKSQGQASKLREQTDVSKPTKTISHKPKGLFLLSAIAILAGGIAIWRSLSNSQQVPEAVTNNIEQAKLTVRTVAVNLEPIQSWAYGDGTVSATTKKTLVFSSYRNN